MKHVYDTLDALHLYLSSDLAIKDDDLLGNWVSEVIENGNYSFERGLLGLGWLIAYLNENNYIEGDADEILEDIDDTLYKLTIKEVLAPVMDVEQLLHYVTYYQQRLQHKSKAHFYRRFTHVECMKLLLEKLNRFLLEQDDTASTQTIYDQINVILKYSYLIKTYINESLVEEAFYSTVEKLLSFFEQERDLMGWEEDIAKLSISVRQYENPHWVYRIRHIYETGGSHTSNKGECRYFFWRNICSEFQLDKLYSNNTNPASKIEKYNIYLYHTNIKPID